MVGLPTILQDLHASIVHGIWIITGYTLMTTILLVLLGRLADLYGRVRLYNMGFAIFTVGSLLCALSRTGEQLVIFRFFQGAGAALLMANSAAIITDAFPSKELGMGLGTNMMASNLGAIAGYTLSGVMITYFGWRSIFLDQYPHRNFRDHLGLSALKRNPGETGWRKIRLCRFNFVLHWPVDDFACLDYRRSDFRPQYCYPCRWIGFFCGGYICRVKAKVSDTRFNTFQNKAICRGKFRQFLELSCIQLRPVSQVAVSSIDIGLQCFKNGRFAYPDGNRHLRLKSNKRKTGG